LGVIAKPLYEATKRLDTKSLKWTRETDHAYKTLKKALTENPTVGIPSLTKPFVLHVSVKKGIAVGVLTQNLGTKPYPVGYLSKKNWMGQP
jgi:hypothetical protein